MKERPILMSAPMVRAILAGSKTQTRRVIKPRLGGMDDLGFWGYDTTDEDDAEVAMFGDAPGYFPQRIKCPYGRPGDRLWVRETWATRVDIDPAIEPAKARHYTMYQAEGKGDPHDVMNWHDFGGRWRPSIHMPRWASRITLEITGVRVERVQDISEDDARAESAQAFRLEWWQGYMRVSDGHRAPVEIGGDEPPEWMEHPEKQISETTARENFHLLWDSINAKRGFAWDSNPWVWVLEFKRTDA